MLMLCYATLLAAGMRLFWEDVPLCKSLCDRVSLTLYLD